MKDSSTISGDTLEDIHSLRVALVVSTYHEFVTGPLRDGAVAALRQAGHRVALFSIVAFLIVGLFLLLRVNEKIGREAARESQ